VDAAGVPPLLEFKADFFKNSVARLRNSQDKHHLHSVLRTRQSLTSIAVPESLEGQRTSSPLLMISAETISEIERSDVTRARLTLLL